MLYLATALRGGGDSIHYLCMAHTETIRLRWNAPEYFKNEHSVDWYWTVGLLIIASAGIAIWLQNILFAVIIVVAGILIFIIARREPKTFSVEVSDVGISIGGQLYVYETLDGFWIETTHPEGPKLLIDTSRTFMLVSVINIDTSVSTEHLRTVLLEHLDERVIQEPMLARILEAIF